MKEEEAKRINELFEDKMKGPELNKIAVDSVNEWVRNRMRNPRPFIDPLRDDPLPLHRFFVIMHDPEYMVTFEHISVHGVQSIPTWGIDSN